MKLRITRYSVDVVKQVQALISNVEVYNGVEGFRRKEISYLTFDTTDECDAYIAYARKHMDELGFIQVERKASGEDDSEYEIVLHKGDIYITPTPYSGTDLEYNKVYKKVVKRLGKPLQNGYGALQSKLKDVGCKKVSYTIVEDQLQLTFKYKGEKGVLNVISDYSNGAIEPMCITLELSTDDALNLKFLKRLNKILKK